MDYTEGIYLWTVTGAAPVMLHSYQTLARYYSLRGSNIEASAHICVWACDLATSLLSTYGNCWLVSTYVVCERLSDPLFWSTEYPPPPQMKIVRESKSESFRIPPPKWKLSESPNPRASEYPPKWKLSLSPNPGVSEYPPTPHPQWKLSESPNPRVSEYPTIKWKLSVSPNPRVSEYPPQVKIVRESRSESFRIPPQWKLSESPNLRVSEYTPLPPPQNWKNFRFQTSEKSCNPRDRMWRLICNPRGYHSFTW